MPPVRARTCPSCRKYLAGGGTCPRCSASGPQPGATRAFARNLRAQTASPQAAPQPAASGLWGPITGEVRREQETWTGRAWGTTVVVIAGLMAPMMVAILTGSRTAGGAIGGLFAMLAVLMLPIALMIVLMSRAWRSTLVHGQDGRQHSPPGDGAWVTPPSTGRRARTHPDS